MVRKDFKQTYNVWGLEAPRNSMEQPVEASYCAVGDNIPYSYEVRYEWPQKACTTEASMKKLINEEISQQPKPKRSAPNVVARLMGMDTLPLDEKFLQPEKKNITRHHTDEEKNKKGIGSRSQFKFSSMGHEEFDTFHHENIASFSSHIHTKEKKSKPREHPQEEELQKFKKEFQAWQAIRFRECSKVADLDTISDQVLAQETLNKEKANLYANSARISMTEKPRELGDQASNGTTHEKGSSKYQICSLSKRSPSEDFDQYSSPARIVVLMPGPERMTDNDDSRASSSGFSEEKGGLEDFLEEVKERLKCELQGKIKKESVVRGGGIETRYSEKVSAPKQIAQRIAKHVRESVSRDLGMNLLRSESTKSYRSEIDRFNGSSSPEYINRGTRRILVEKMRNVLKGETNQNYPKVSYGCSDSSLECNKKEITEEEVDMQTKSFRCGFDDANTVHRELPPMSLMRSLSAPISRASFGKLLLEDRHVLTGAHIRRKHEAIESVTGGSKKRKKEKSKFKERVSSIRYSFTLKGRLFGRKMPLEQPQNCEYNTLRDIRMGPTVMMNYTYRNENFTEVPPSPASVCSSVQDEFWRETDHLSSTMSDISPLEDTTRVFREISSNLSNLQRQLKELDGGDTKEETEEHTHLAEMKFEDDAQAYIRDLIVASDIHKSSSDKVFSRWDPLAKPISNQIFEEVEESYDKRVKNNEESTQQKLDHKLLYGLLNEAISVVLGPPMIMSRFRKEIAGTTQPPRGKKLLDCVWEIVSGHLYSSSDKGHLSLDGMMARDFEFTPWPCKLNSDEIEFMGKEIETQITGYLIQELVKDISSL